MNSLRRFNQAVCNGHYKIVRRMLNDHSFQKLYTEGLLCDAVDSANLDVVTVILEHFDIDNDEEGHSALHSAACNGSIDIIKCLFQHDVFEYHKYGHEYAWNVAIEYDNPEVALLLLQNFRAKIPADCGHFALDLAAHKGYIDIVKFLLQSGMDPSYDNNLILCSAAENGHTEVVKILLADKRVNPFDRVNGAMYSAIVNGHEDIVHIFMLDPRFSIRSYINGAL